jgi:molybdopterin/thiamine biosynthesis adenylyltransferase
MNDEQLLRYSRHLMLNGFDVAGQEALLAARVLVVGLGGLGSPASMYLAAAGVGTLVLADDDIVDVSNLQRQIAHKTASIGHRKTASARQTLLELNPSITVETVEGRLERDAMDELVGGCSAVLDCSDNFNTRFALNAACQRHRVPLVSGAAIRTEAQLSVFDARDPAAPCYRCLYQEGVDADLSCSESGVLSPLVGMVGSMQALECIKVLSGFGKPLVGRLLLIDAATMQIRTLTLQKNPDCPVCRD